MRIQNDDVLHTEFCGMHFNTPLVLLSGCVGFGDEYKTRIKDFSNRDAGAVCLKGTTLEPWHGNPRPRFHETPSGVLNSVGLHNPGSRVVIDQILPSLELGETRFIANVVGFTIKEYAELARRFDDSPVGAIEINISCPNVRKGPVFGNDPEMSQRVVAACRDVTSKPIITKLSPNQTDICENARRCIEAGTDGLSVANTYAGMAIDTHTRRPILGAGTGGLSGPAIKPMSLLKVHQVYQIARNYNVPIIGQGGVRCPQDVLEFMIAGASAVGIGTALFSDPWICKYINKDLMEYARTHNLDRISQIVGTLEPWTKKKSRLDRVSFVGTLEP